MSAFILFCSLARAASISTVKNQKVLINLEGDTANAGDEFFLINPSTGKKAAIIRVNQARNGKALADILKGKAEVGYTLQAKGPAVVAGKESSAEPTSAEATDATGYLHILKPSYGLLGEYLMNSMSVAVSDALNKSDTVAMKGTGFGLGGFYEYIATNDLAIRGVLAYEQFASSGTALVFGCSGKTSASCNANINYLSAYGLAQYYFTKTKYRTWIGAGGGFLLALSKSASALNESQISSNQILTIAVGSDIQWNRHNYLPLSLEYNYFPPSSTVKASSIILKAGWAWNL